MGVYIIKIEWNTFFQNIFPLFSFFSIISVGWKEYERKKIIHEYDTTLKELLEVTDPDVELRLATEEERRMESLLKNL